MSSNYLNIPSVPLSYRGNCFIPPLPTSQETGNTCSLRIPQFRVDPELSVARFVETYLRQNWIVRQTYKIRLHSKNCCLIGIKTGSCCLITQFSSLAVAWYDKLLLFIRGIDADRRDKHQKELHGKASSDSRQKHGKVCSCLGLIAYL